MQTVFLIVDIVLSALYFLALSMWGGGLVVMAIATRQINGALQKKRTEARQIVSRLRGVFQRIELISLIVLWIATLARLLLEHVLRDGYPGVWRGGDSIALGVLVVPTLAAAHSTFYLTRAIRTHEGQLGSYADKNEQTRIRKTLANLHRQGQTLTWLKAGAVAALIVASVAATV